MTLTLDEFKKKYNLYPKQPLIAINSITRANLVGDLNKMFKQIVNFIDLITRSSTKHCGELLLSIAHKQDEYGPVKNKIAECMNIKPSNLKPSYRHLKENRYIVIKEEGGRKRVFPNYEEFPEFRFITELMSEFWECKFKRLKNLDAWRGKQ